MAELSARIIAKASGTAAEEPLAADLEVAELAVNTADGKLFTKHTDGSVVTISGGGGGAVDSVNGETGVISLGIQDMDDFELKRVAGSVLFPNRVPNTSSIAAEGDWTSGLWGGAGGGFVVAWLSAASGGGDMATEAERIGVGDTVDFLWPDASTSTETVASIYTSGNRKGFVVNDPHSSIYSGYANGTPLWITSDAILGGADIPLAESDILQWNDAAQKFNPVQLPDAAATRASLGIGEYADDAAAGTGGVASGAMYYNTTSSDYRLKS